MPQRADMHRLPLPYLTLPYLNPLRFASFCISFYVVPCLFVSSATDIIQLLFGLPGFLFPWGFHSGACLVTFVVQLQNDKSSRAR